jgi:hypothetical protein
VDSASQAVVLTALGADFLQTRHIVADGMESNPVMGERGERVHPLPYFATVAVAHTALARALPQPWRRLSQVALVAVQCKVIARNAMAGYAVQW